MRSVAALAADLVAGPVRAPAPAVGLVAVLVQAVVLVLDLVRVAAVEAAAAQERDQGPEVERDRAPVQVLEAVQDTDRVAAMALDRAADRGPAAGMAAALAQVLERVGSRAMASVFTSGMTSSESGPSSTRLAFRPTTPHFFAAVLVQSQARADSMGR